MIGTLSLGLTTDISSIVHHPQQIISAVVGEKKKRELSVYLLFSKFIYFRAANLNSGNLNLSCPPYFKYSNLL